MARTQRGGGGRNPVKVSYALDKDGYGFKLGDYDHNQPVMIDPLLQATYLGGSGTETALEIAVHPTSGDVYVLGATRSLGAGFTNTLPGTSGGWTSAQSSTETAFLSRLSADLKTLMQTTYLEGIYYNSYDGPHGSVSAPHLLIHPGNSDVYVWGEGPANNIAGTPGLAGGAITTSPFSAMWQSYLSRFSPDLIQLRQSTLVSTNDNFNPTSMAVNKNSGDIYFAGSNSSLDSITYPDYNVRVQRIPADLKSAITQTQFGSTSMDYGYGVAVHPVSGDVYVTGKTQFNNLPNPTGGFPNTSGGYQPANNSMQNSSMADGFIAQLSADLSALKQATYLGGTYDDSVDNIVFNSTGDYFYLTGHTCSDDFPEAVGSSRQPSSIMGARICSEYFAKMSSDLKSLTKSTMAQYGVANMFLFVHPSTGDIFAIGDGPLDNKSGYPVAEHYNSDLTYSHGVFALNNLANHPGIAYTMSQLTGDIYIVGNQNIKTTVFPQTTGGFQATPATKAGGQTDIYIARYSSDDLQNPLAKADLQLTQVSNLASVQAGSNIVFSLTVKNNGPATANSVKITDVLPSSVTFNSASTSCGYSGTTITCSTATLANGASQTFNITVTPTVSGGLSNTASVTATETDPNSANNSATQTVTVSDAPAPISQFNTDLEVSQSVNRTAVKMGGNLVFNLKVKNNGPDAASSVKLTDDFPSSANMLSVADGCSINAPAVSCNIGNLASGASMSYSLSVSPTAEGSFASTATVTGAETDPNTGNNTSTQTVNVSNNNDPALDNSDYGVGSKLTITGQGFGNKKGSVKIGNKTAAVISWSDGAIVLKLPTLKAGIYAVKVTGKNKAVFNLGPLTFHAPEISGLSIGSMAKNTKVTFTVNGQYFGTVKPTVYLLSSKNKRTRLTVLKGFNDKSLMVATPKLKAGNYRVLVTNSAGNSQLVGIVVQ